MRQTRRTFLASASVVATAAVAGCGQITGEEPLEFESTPAEVPGDVLEESGYEELERDEIELERTFEAAGEERTVTVTNWQVSYEKETDSDLGLDDDFPRAVFTTVTTPQVDILGQQLNPVGGMDNEEFVERAQEQYGGLEDIEPDEEDTRTVLGEETTRTRFTATADFNGSDVDVFAHVSNPVGNDGDFVATVGGHPQQLPDEESDILTMMESIRHGE